MTLPYSYVVVGATVVGCTWYLSHLARGPHGEPHTPHLNYRLISELPVQSFGPNPIPPLGTK